MIRLTTRERETFIAWLKNHVGDAEAIERFLSRNKLFGDDLKATRIKLLVYWAMIKALREQDSNEDWIPIAEVTGR